MRNGLQFLLFSALSHVTVSLHEFVYVTKPMNWKDAQKYCRKHYTDLATVDDQEDHDQLLNTVGRGQIWIGLFRSTYPGEFVWSDQSSSSFRKWIEGMLGTKLCAKVYKGVWYDSSCVHTYPFACYMGKKSQTVKLEVKSSENLIDTEIILLMEQILKEKGLAEHDQLSWRIQSNGNVFQKKNQKKNAPKYTCVS